jgi:molybdenum cofactor biosynthesis enzyme MoaA
MPTDIQLNVRNFAKLKQAPQADYGAIRMDSNNTCNVHCVYCHNPRSAERIDLDEFRQFLTERVVAVETFQVGCVMEPTLDERLADFMLAISRSPARPRRELRLQTNGILLHRHDPGRFIDAGLGTVAISVDSVTAGIHKGLRGGTSLVKVQDNIVAFHEACPKVKLAFLTTVTSENIDMVDDLVEWGIGAGVTSFTFRQMFHDRTSSIVDHERMAGLLVDEAAFAVMRERVQARFTRRAWLHFLSNGEILARARNVRTASLMEPAQQPLG